LSGLGARAYELLSEGELPAEDSLFDPADATEEESQAFGLRTQQRLTTSVSSREGQHALAMVPATAWRLESYSLNLATLGILQYSELFQLILIEINGMGV
jgi:hypothetical protein